MIAPTERQSIASELRQAASALETATTHTDVEHAAQWVSSLDKRITDLIELEEAREGFLADVILMAEKMRNLPPKERRL